MGRLAAIAFSGALWAAPLAARADERAAALAEQGRRAMLEGRPADACPKFAESQRLAPDMNTLVQLGECNAAIGKTASAWVAYRDAAGLAARAKDGRESALRAKAAELEARAGRIVIVPPPGARATLSVTLDGIAVPRDRWGTELPVDPGSHAITASTLLGSDWSTRAVVAAEGGVQTVTIPGAVIGIADKPTTSSSDPDAKVGREEAENRGGTQRTIGLLVAGAGVVGIGVGAVFGLIAKSKLDDSNHGHCGANDRCDAVGVGLRHDYLSAASVSTVAFLAGAGAVVGGVVLYFTAPRGAVTVSANGGRLWVEGSF